MRTSGRQGDAPETTAKGGVSCGRSWPQPAPDPGRWQSGLEPVAGGRQKGQGALGFSQQGNGLTSVLSETSAGLPQTGKQLLLSLWTA